MRPHLFSLPVLLFHFTFSILPLHFLSLFASFLLALRSVKGVDLRKKISLLYQKVGNLPLPFLCDFHPPALQMQCVCSLLAVYENFPEQVSLREPNIFSIIPIIGQISYPPLWSHSEHYSHVRSKKILSWCIRYKNPPFEVMFRGENYSSVNECICFSQRTSLISEKQTRTECEKSIVLNQKNARLFSKSIIGILTILSCEWLISVSHYSSESDYIESCRYWQFSHLKKTWK